MYTDFFGFDGYTRKPEGYLSWQHLTFVTSLMVLMIALAVVLGLRNRNRSDKEKNRVLIAAALLMDGVEIVKIILKCTVGGNPMAWLDALPLYLCSIQFITLPLAAFSRGRIKNASLDFVFVFGVLGAVLGTYGAGQNYAAYPVLSFDNVISGITHSAAGFASIYIMVARMASMEKRNVGIVCGLIIGFSIAAYAVDVPLNKNYMFLMQGDGTPYDILYNLVNGSKVLYPLGVVVLFILYIALFYTVYYYLHRKKAAPAASAPVNN